MKWIKKEIRFLDNSHFWEAIALTTGLEKITAYIFFEVDRGFSLKVMVPARLAFGGKDTEITVKGYGELSLKEMSKDVKINTRRMVGSKWIKKLENFK